MAKKSAKRAAKPLAQARPPTLRRDRRFYEKHLPYVNLACVGVSTIHRHLFGLHARVSLRHVASLQSALSKWPLEKLCRASHVRSPQVWREHIPTFAALANEIGGRIEAIVTREAKR